MSLTPAGLSAVIKTELGNVPGFGDKPQTQAAAQAFADALGKAIATYINANLVINVPGTGLLAPPGTAGGPVTGAAQGTPV